jgi:WD repeat-containing protein 55
VLLFSWKDWKDCSDRFKGHPGSINDLVKVNENELFSACSDGVVRKIEILPNRLLDNVVSVKSGDGIERLRVSREGLIGVSTIDGLYMYNPQPEEVFDRTSSSVSSESEENDPEKVESEDDESSSEDGSDSDEEIPKKKQKTNLEFHPRLSFSGLD